MAYDAGVRDLEANLGLVASVDLTQKCAGLVHKLKRSAETEEEEEALRIMILEAYEVCLSVAGCVPWSLPLWRAYQAFIESWPASFEDDNRDEALRKLLRRGATTPVQGCDQLLRDYELVGGEAPDFHEKAMIEAPERARLWTAAVEASPEGVVEWRRAIMFEAGDSDCVAAAYRAALCHARDAAQLWHEFAHWTLLRTGEPQSVVATPAGPSAAAEIYARCPRKIPVLIACYGDVLENMGCVDEARRVYRDHGAFGLLGRLELSRAGREACRDVFASTYGQRASYHAYAAHAALEDDAQVKSRIWELAQTQHNDWILQADFVLDRAAFFERRGEPHRTTTWLLRALLALEEANPPRVDKPRIVDEDKWDALSCLMARSGAPFAPVLARLVCRRSLPAPADLPRDVPPGFFPKLVTSGLVDFSELDFSWWARCLRGNVNLLEQRDPHFGDCIDASRFPMDFDKILTYNARADNFRPPPPDAGEPQPMKIDAPLGRGGRRGGPGRPDLPRTLDDLLKKLSFLRQGNRPGHGQRDRIEFLLETLSRQPLDAITNLRHAGGFDDDDLDKPPPPPDIFRRRRRAKLQAQKLQDRNSRLP